MKEILQRCGRCGDWSADPKLYSQKEQDEADLTECGCYQEETYQPTIQEMADAGIISLDSQGNPH